MLWIASYGHIEDIQNRDVKVKVGKGSNPPMSTFELQQSFEFVQVF